MGNSQKKNPTTRFLIISFIGLLIFSIIIFSLLGIYMSQKSETGRLRYWKNLYVRNE